MIGATLGSYRIVSKIGEGGMGVVYLAAHTFLERKAAVKVLLPVFSNDQEVVNRFVNEAKAATVINHPGIVQVFDFDKLPDGSAYLVMEFLEGESLDARLKRLGHVSVFEALRITHHCASALAAAHQAGIVHRDLKPENIFMVPDPQIEGGERAKILDFGIAKLTDDQQRGSVKTRTGSVMGTPTYMAPEQCLGAGEVDHRADIYALGCVMFHLLCGRPPFVGQGVGELLIAHVREPAPWAASINPNVPPAVDVLLQRTLAKEPGARFATMGELSSALEALIGQARSGSWAEVPNMQAANPHMPSPGSYPGTGPKPGSYPGTVSGVGSYPGTGSAPRMLTGSTIGAAAAQNLTHGTLPGTGRKRALIIAMAAVATMSIIATAILGSQANTAQDDIPVLQPLHEGPATVLDTPSTETGELAVVDPAIEIDEPDEPPPVQPIKVQINSEPAGAKVFAEDSDEPLGVTPYVYEALPADKEITLRLDLNGYKSNVVTFRGDLSGQAQATLHREQKRERRPHKNSKPDDEFGYR